MVCSDIQQGDTAVDQQGTDILNSKLRGLIPRIVEQIFESILIADINIEYTVKVSYMEIYQERIKDLLARELCFCCRQVWLRGSCQRQPLDSRGQGSRRVR